VQLLGRLQEHEELALVVGDAASVEPFVAKRRLERVGLPELERRRRLDVEVAVADDCRRVAVPRRGSELAERERMAVPVAELRFAAGPADEVADPLARLAHVAVVRRIGADARNADELGQVVEPGLVHGGAVYADTDEELR
jgi:hypothetical protein